MKQSAVGWEWFVDPAKVTGRIAEKIKRDRAAGKPVHAGFPEAQSSFIRPGHAVVCFTTIDGETIVTTEAENA